MLLKGWKVGSAVKANRRTHQRAHWAAQLARGVLTEVEGPEISWQDSVGPASDVPVVHGGALDVVAFGVGLRQLVNFIQSIIERGFIHNKTV